MKKRYRYGIRIIAVLLAVVVAATTVLHNDEMLLARETFSGLQNMLAQRESVTIVEVVDDFEESSMGYLISGMEPFRRDGFRVSNDLLDDLIQRGLITTGDTDDWNTYPLRYEVTETEYSDHGGNQELIDAGFRQQGNEAVPVGGYFVPINPEDSDDPDDRHPLYCLNYSRKRLSTMRPGELAERANELMESYAPNNPEKCPDGYYDYEVGNAGDITYFKFVVATHQEAEQVQAQRMESRSASVSSMSAVTAGIATTTPEPEAVPGVMTPTEPVKEENGSEEEEALEELEEEKTDTEQQEEEKTDDEQMEGETEETADTPADAPETDGTGNDEELTGNDEEPADNDAESEAQSEQGGTDSASAVIYVELDENNKVLVASLGYAGVEDLPGSSSNTENAKKENVAPTPSVAAQGSNNGINAIVEPTPGSAPTQTPAPNTETSGADNKNDQNKDGEGNDGTTPGDGDKTTPDGENNGDGTTSGEGNNDDKTTSGDGNNEESETSGKEDADGDEDGDNAKDGDDEDGESAEDGADEVEEEDEDKADDETEGGDEDGDKEGWISVSYKWEDAPSCGDGESLKEGGSDNAFDLAIPEGEKVEKGTTYTVDTRYGEGMTIDWYVGEKKQGTYTFSGWFLNGELVTEPELEITEDTETLELTGSWSYERFEKDGDAAVYRIIYQWVLTPEGDEELPSDLNADNIVLKSQVQTFSVDSVPEIARPEEEHIESGASFIVNEDYGEGDVFDAYDEDGNLIGTATFLGWRLGEDGEIQEGGSEIEPDGDMELVGVWRIALLAARDNTYTINFIWQYEQENGENKGNYSFPKGKIGDNSNDKLILDAGQALPGNVLLIAGDWLRMQNNKGEAELSVLNTRSVIVTLQPNEAYNLNRSLSIGTIVEVLDKNEELLGTYKLIGWENENGQSIEDGIINLSDSTTSTVYGVWSYQPAMTADMIIGTGYTYVYIKDEIQSNDWFRYYVLGLEKEEFSKVNIRLLTYLADGSDYREFVYGYQPPDHPSLTEAIGIADLVYLNTNGVWMDDNGNTHEVGGRFPAESAKALLARACNVDRSKRLAVILDNSSVLNQVDENVQKVSAILRQEDIAKAYISLSEDGASYDHALSSVEWQRLIANTVIQNGGNFVRENVYCVSHLQDDFSNSSYLAGESVVRPGSMPALANADFENRFTNGVTDLGFSEVYRAILKENYERAHNGGQASMDEYVMPATAVAYIMNYRDYDPIIYKDQIRVLELEPCRDYTYYYDGEYPGYNGGTELERKMKFAQDWAPDFIAKLEADPNAITIDGMTTSEFCGKILDIYEEYDVIYFGSNSGILNVRNEAEGFKWVKSSSAYEGTISADNPYQPESWNKASTCYTYHDGNWYRLDRTGETREVEIFGPRWCYGGRENGKEWVFWNDNNEGKHGWYVNGSLTSEPCPPRLWEQIHGQQFDFEGATYKYREQRWYEERPVYAEGAIVQGGPRGGNNWYDNGNEGTSQWMWKSTGGDEGWYKWTWTPAVRYTNYYGDPSMNGMLYTHVGDLMETWAISYFSGHLANNGDYTYGYRASGNDIVKTQVEELNHYLQGGSLIILSSDFITTDQNNKQVINSSDVVHTTGGGRYCGILDTSSYVYQFVAGAFEKDAAGNDVPKYANLIVEDYGNGDLKDTEAFVEALNQQKVTLNLYAAPEAYEYKEEGAIGTIGERSLLQKESDGRYYLNYEFIIGNLSAVAPLTTSYNVQLFLDTNSDGIYNMATEELSDITVINAQTGAAVEKSGGAYQLQANIPYRVRRELPDGYVGCIGWKLMVTQNGNGHIHDSVTGLTAVPVELSDRDEIDPVTGKKILHVLQLVPNGVTINLEEQTEREWLKDGEWNQLLFCLPDFKIDFDSIGYVEFAECWSKGYNGGVDGVLRTARRGVYDGHTRYADDGSIITDPNANYGFYGYRNLYQYDMIIVGFVDNYPSIPSQAAIDAILRYADTGKSVLFTHDTTTYGWSAQPDNFNFGGQDGQPLSMSIRELCGMDRFGVSVDWYWIDENGVKHSNRDGSPIRNTEGAWNVPYNESGAVYQWWGERDGNHTRDVAFAPNSNQTTMVAQTQGYVWSMIEGHNTKAFNWGSRGAGTPTSALYRSDYAGQTCKVSQVNSGIITQYPYDIPETIDVAYTHPQYYQLDLETDRDGDGRGDVVCWYTINDRNAGDWNDTYNFSPNDVRNNYYIYNKGNITYSGMGHTSDPNALTTNEKKLFINTFIAAYNAGIRNPSVRIVENGSVNAPDLENMSIPFDGIVPDLGSIGVIDKTTVGTCRVYYQVKDNNITEGTRNLSVKYYIGNPLGSDTVIYQDDNTIRADLFANDVLTTYSADTNEPVAYNQVRSGQSYYVYVPLNMLLNNESLDFYVEVDLTMADEPDRVAAFDVDKLTIAKLKMFLLD